MHFLYKILNIINTKCYIGQSVSPKNRWANHKNYAKKQDPKQYIHRAMIKHGIENFIFEVIATCQSQEDANELEVELIKQYNSRDKRYGYNLEAGGNSSSGPDHPNYGKPSPKKGIPLSEEHKARVSASKIGIKLTEETKAQFSLLRQEEFKNGRVSGRKGKTNSPEMRQKVSLALKGKPRPDLVGKTPHNKGKKASEETKRKLSESLKGRPAWNAGTKGVMSPNQTSFKKGEPAPNKGRKKIIDENGKVRYVKPEDL